MGLDSYLYKEYENIKKGSKLADAIQEVVGDEKPVKVVSEVAYWRKCNQIHRYFLEVVGDGDPDQTRVECGWSDIKELYDRCHKVLKHKDLASELLPTQEGFFFGSTEYDEYYFEDLEYTIEQLQPIIDAGKPEDWTWFAYECSW